jgi:glucose-1-phosphate thymidylyltransferase
MKGIILAGGTGTRLYPLTKSVSKQLLPVFDKPMIYYPLSLLMLAGIQDVLIISTPEDLPRFQHLLSDGRELGMNFEYIAQPSPDGLTQAFILGKKFIGTDNVCLVLGDNIFYGHGLPEKLRSAITNLESNAATIFGYHVSDPERYGIVSFNTAGEVLNLEEKPSQPKSNYAITGLYFYPNDVIYKAPQVVPSERGELEITDLNRHYLEEGRLNVQILGRGYAWLDTGTHQSLLEASTFIEIIERRQGLKVGCIEEIAFDNDFIDEHQITKIAKSMSGNQYGRYLMRKIENKNAIY